MNIVAKKTLVDDLPMAKPFSSLSHYKSPKFQLGYGSVNR